MTATPSPTPAHSALRTLRRDPANGMVAGVCAGLGKQLGVDPLLLRLVFAVTAVATGVGIVAYALAWILLPAEAEAGAPAHRRMRTRRGAFEVAAGVGCLVVAVLLGFRELGLPFSDAIAWPLALVAAGGALIWRQSLGGPGDAAAVAVPVRGAVLPPPAKVSAPVVISRVGIGVTLVIAAAIVFLQFTGALAAATDVALAALVVAIALAVIFAPWFVRLLKSLTAERAERIRSQERAEVAAHLHDSVLQTLALVQKRADDPREVAALARRQERELRAWLNAAPGDDAGGGRLVRALQDAADAVEQAHGVNVDVVAVGDRPLDRDTEALVAAAREAMLNAAKFGAGSPIAVYAEVSEDRVQVFVRDRGPGFDPDAVPDDRRGVRESIVGRMNRHGGRARIAAADGNGTEVELVLERAP